MSAQFTSGRGGAGNMTKERSPSAGAQDLATPNLKQDAYTTGRGGSGNMAKNDFGAEARAAQDVEVPITSGQPKDGEHYHFGRGGAANTTIAGDAQRNGSQGSAKEGGAEKTKGLLEKIGLR